MLIINHMSGWSTWLGLRINFSSQFKPFVNTMGCTHCDLQMSSYISKLSPYLIIAKLLSIRCHMNRVSRPGSADSAIVSFELTADNYRATDQCCTYSVVF